MTAHEKGELSTKISTELSQIANNHIKELTEKGVSVTEIVDVIDVAFSDALAFHFFQTILSVPNINSKRAFDSIPDYLQGILQETAYFIESRIKDNADYIKSRHPNFYEEK